MASTRHHPWATAREARDQLGVSERTLARWRTSGLFQADQQWLRKFLSPNSPVQYHLDHCQNAMRSSQASDCSKLQP